MPDILLIQPPIQDFYLTAKRTFPYGLACIAAAVQRRGYSVEIVDALASGRSRQIPWPKEIRYLEPYYGRSDRSPFALFHTFRHYGNSFEHIGRLAGQAGAFLVGISTSFTAYSQMALATAAAVKANLPHCKVVLGGHHATAMAAECLADPAVDFVIRGEGEASLPLLADALTSGRAVDAVPGIAMRDANGNVYQRSPAMLPRMDDRPLPDLSLVRMNRYARKGQPASVVVTSRGCPMQCSYCVFGGPQAPPFDQRSVASVLSELENAIEGHNVRFIDFEDEHLSLRKQWFLELLEGITRRWGHLGLELRAMNGLYPPSLDAELVAAMQKAGFGALNLSLGSSVADQSQRFNRPDVTADFDNALRWARLFKMPAVGYVLVAAPGQRAADSVTDLVYLASRRVLAAVSVFYPAPGSRDYLHCQRQGLLPQRMAQMRATALPIEDTTTRLETITLLRLGRIVNTIKSILDSGQKLPQPRPCKDQQMVAPGQRRRIGRDLLAWFLHDGQIRGVDRSGQVYRHRTRASLTQLFIERIMVAPLRGTQ